ncbi:hypothetical protein JL107_16195 [Nakamurella flavida]|uniref:Imelysin-like domain-containing protein n=1 Tax=Nakamurella flavida TaxID=363630 RepID=A0A939C4D6_9ACTN|nr:iron uptake system protein EfeO [Nakamurella flavida]MBM9477991.1 hypothetical protein [Nakamurella flavida]MDP9778293.1 iron uptake system component EfeO [Nakamurella flavida]
MRIHRPGSVRRPVAVTAAALTALTLAACGSSPAASTGAATSAATSAAESSGGAGSTGSSTPAVDGQVTVTVSDADGCTASPDTVPAGPVTFTVTNLDAVGVTEVELVSDQRIVGERENLAPGFDSTFSARLDGGSYEIYCPGGSTERRAFTVTGGQAQEQGGDVGALLTQATVDYATYVDDQIEFLLPPVQELADAIRAGDLAAAQQAYAKARPFYERIEPVAESFPDLDPAIDLREGDVEAGTPWTGFHPIEKALFVDRTTDGLTELADQLVADCAELQSKAAELSAATTAGSGGYQAFEIANGASGLLDEVLASKITGEEEAYSRIDLLDFEANVEGSLQAFATLKPALDVIDPTLVPQISSQFDALTTTLSAYRDPAALGGWRPYDQLTTEDKKTLTDALLAVQEPLSAISAKITT